MGKESVCMFLCVCVRADCMLVFADNEHLLIIGHQATLSLYCHGYFSVTQLVNMFSKSEFCLSSFIFGKIFKEI